MGRGRYHVIGCIDLPFAKKQKRVTEHTYDRAFISSSYLPLHKTYTSFFVRPFDRRRYISFPFLKLRESDGISRHPINALLVSVSEPFNALLPSPLQQVIDSIQTHIQVLEGRPERDPDKVVAGRVEEISTVRGVDVEEDSWDHDRLFLEEFFEEGLAHKNPCGSVEDRREKRGEGRRRTRPLFKGGGRLSKFNQM